MKTNKILSEMLQLDIQQDCQQAIKEALAYRFSSVAQYILLMKRKGFDCRQQLQNICLYKHGTQQGTLALSMVIQRLAVYQISPGKISRIQALIVKYKTSYDSVLRKTGNRYPPKIYQPVFPTDHLSS